MNATIRHISSSDIAAPATKYIDPNPDGGYALRILREYRTHCYDIFYRNHAGTEVFRHELDERQDERAAELDAAITVLEARSSQNPESEKRRMREAEDEDL
jgi:hypothetical protein